jgi:hypothetical protein
MCSESLKRTFRKLESFRSQLKRQGNGQSVYYLTLIGAFSQATLSLALYKYSPLSSINTLALKMKTICLSETSVSTYESTLRQNPEEGHHYPH